MIDTNVLIFDTFEDSEHHAEASSLLDSIREWIIPSLVVHEYVWALRRLGLSFESVREKVSEYLLDPRATVITVELDDLLFSLTRARSFDDYNDLVILSIALRSGAALATFDEGLRRASSSARVEVLP